MVLKVGILKRLILTLTLMVCSILPCQAESVSPQLSSSVFYTLALCIALLSASIIFLLTVRLKQKRINPFPSIIIARVGGEEFAIILHQTSIEDATFILNRLRKSIYTNSDIPCTVSCGITDVTSEAENVYKRADIALYEAKSSGRNKLITYPSYEISETLQNISPQLSA